MRSAIFLVTAALLFASAAITPMSAQPGGFGKGKFTLDPYLYFDFLAKGKGTIDSADTREMRAELEAFARANKLDPAMITRAQFVAFMNAKNGGGAKILDTAKQLATPAEEVLRAAGLNADGDALLAYFQERTRANVDLMEMLVLARQLGETDPDRRAKAVAKILGRGPWAVPALHHVINGLDNPLAVQRARHCLELLEGKRSTEVPIAAATLLAQRKPAAAAEILLAFLPLADDQSVVDAVKSALSTIAARPGKCDAALLAALGDPLPLRRAIAVEVLAGSGKPEVLPELHKLLADAMPQVRLRAALAMTEHLDEMAIDALIELLAKLPASERRRAEAALHQLAGEWSPSPSLAGDDELSRKIRRDVWSAWWRAVDGAALLDAFRRRTLTTKEAARAQTLIEQLNDRSFEARELAGAELVAFGFKAAGLLRDAKSRDAEHASRIEQCLKEIAQRDASDKLPLSAPRLLAARKPAGASDALLGFLPFGEDREMRSEIVKALTGLQRSQGSADTALIKALTDPLAVRRIAAAEALVGAGGASHPSLRKLLTDADPQVRLPVAMVLVQAQDREAVPALIELVGELPPSQVRDAEEILQRLAGDTAPTGPPGADVVARKKRVGLWQAWWKEHGKNVDLARLEKTSDVVGLTMVAEIKSQGGAANPFGGKKVKGGLVPAAPGNETDRIVALDRDGKARWQIESLNYPMDFQLLPGSRVLIAEYGGKRVTERDTSGKIVWEVTNLPGAPTNVQRLSNGNTFIAIYNNATVGGLVMEVDRAGKTVTSLAVGKGPKGLKDALVPDEGLLIAAQKTAGGNMVFLFAASTSCVRVDANGKEIGRFTVAGINSAGVTSREGNIDVTPKDHMLVMQNLGTLTEFDAKGNVIWQANVTGHRATRLTNGNTLVASETRGVVELDASGKTIWQYQPQPGYQAVRAR